MFDKVTVSTRVEDILSRMTVDEKAAMMTGDGFWFVPGVKRLGVRPIRMTDCGHGVTATDQDETCATCFPTAVGQAATWNPELIEQVGAAMGREVRATGNDILLGPMVNIHRTPLNGRSYECYSEDPFLAGKMAAAFVRGVQSQGVGACVKGCTANNQQADQAELDVRMSQRALREIYLPNFRIPVTEAEPWALMNAYKGVNGEHTAGCRGLLTDIVKGEWGFEGFIVSDWRGTHSDAVVNSGLDLEMPGPGKFLRPEDVAGALADGRMSETDLDDHVRRLLGAVVRAEAGEGGPAELDSPRHRQIARDAAAEAIVLLANDGLLPLSDAPETTIAVIGPNAEQARLGGGGSASVAPFYTVGPLAGIRQRAGESIRVIYEEGCSFLGEMTAVYPDFLSIADGASGLEAEFFNNQKLEGEPIFTTTTPQVDFSWGWASPGDRVRRNQWSARWSGRLTPPVSGRYALGAACRDGGLRLFVDGELRIDQWGDAVGEHTDFSPNQMICDRAEVDLVEGVAVEIRLEYYKTANKSALRLEWIPPGWGDSVDRAATAAVEADVAIVCAGLCNAHEGGTNDRSDIELPGRQVELIEAVAAANPRTVVVLANGGPLNVRPWIDSVAAVVETFYGGQAGGAALASVLFGDVNPSGKLPDTHPVRLEDTPAFGAYPGDGELVDYREEIFVGYRHYDANDIDPAFPFGFGLSYTTFAYENLWLSAPTMDAAQPLRVRVDVRNAGERAGKEIVQLYVGDIEASAPRPPRELKGFTKVELAPGQTKTVEFELTPTDLSFFDAVANAWRAEPGVFEVQVGPHSREGLTGRFEYVG